MKRAWFGVCILILFIHGCVDPKIKPEPDGNIDEAVEMIHYSFEGQYSMSLIKESMETMFLKFEIEPVKANYLKIGNTLIEHRKQSSGKFQEMDLINDMIISSADLSFDKQLLETLNKFKQGM